jgi:hypothetical protein
MLAGRALCQKDSAFAIADDSRDDMDGLVPQVRIRRAGRGTV